MLTTRSRRLAAGLLIAVMLACAFAAGVIWHRLRLPPYHQVREFYHFVRDNYLGSEYGLGFTRYEDRDKDLSPRQQAEFERLRSLGYLRARNVARDAGVTLHDEESAYPGLNLSTEGHAPEASLMDMSGNVLHKWHLPLSEAFPEHPGRVPSIWKFWRRVHLLEDGALLAIFEGHSLIKLDRDSRLTWGYAQGVHHDLEVQSDGAIYCLARNIEIVPSFNPEMPIAHDFVVILDRHGREQRRISILEAIRRSPYANLLSRAKRYGDILHTNTLEVLDGSLGQRIPAFQAGNVMLSIPMLNAVVVLDPESEQIVWALTDLWVFQHQPTIVGGGNLLIFDNLGDRSRSRVLEIDPATQQIMWSWSNANGPLASRTNGSVQRLPNGNTLITESNQGRVIEVTRDHRIVWEYYSEHRAGEANELIAQVFEMIRLPADFPVDWLSQAPARQ